MPVTISARIPEETAEQLRSLAREEERTVSDIVNRAIDEHIRCARFPGIYFMTGGSGKRKAKLLGGPSVWSVVLVARGYDMDAEKTADHFEIPVTKIRLALAYYTAYPEEIDARLRRMEEIEENPYLLHPAVRVVHVEDLLATRPDTRSGE
jgi:hypothetical protein